MPLRFTRRRFLSASPLFLSGGGISAFSGISHFPLSADRSFSVFSFPSGVLSFFSAPALFPGGAFSLPPAAGILHAPFCPFRYFFVGYETQVDFIRNDADFVLRKPDLPRRKSGVSVHRSCGNFFHRKYNNRREVSPQGHILPLYSPVPRRILLLPLR